MPYHALSSASAGRGEPRTPSNTNVSSPSHCPRCSSTRLWRAETSSDRAKRVVSWVSGGAQMGPAPPRPPRPAGGGTAAPGAGPGVSHFFLSLSLLPGAGEYLEVPVGVVESMPVQTRQQKETPGRRPSRPRPARRRPRRRRARQGGGRRREECAICLEPAGCWPHRLRCVRVPRGLPGIGSISLPRRRAAPCRGPAARAWQHAFNHGFLAWVSYRLCLAWMDNDFSA